MHKDKRKQQKLFADLDIQEISLLYI